MPVLEYLYLWPKYSRYWLAVKVKDECAERYVVPQINCSEASVQRLEMEDNCNGDKQWVFN